MGSGPLSFRTYREGDETAILRLLNETSNAACSLDEWAWLFPLEEAGRAIVIGERDDEIVAVCAGVSQRLVVDGRRFAGVELRQLASQDPNDADRVLDHFVEVFGKSGRFALALAPFDFRGAAEITFKTLVRDKPASRAPRRFLYRAEPSRDWEPRLDELWERARRSYPAAVIRNADRALRRFAGHPTVRHHRFLVSPRYSRSAVAFAVFADDGSSCCWLDLLWDHEHAGALELLAHISGRLVSQWGSCEERLWLTGDDEAVSVLVNCGFQERRTSSSVAAVRSFDPEIDTVDFVGRAYLTAADAEGFGA